MLRLLCLAGLLTAAATSLAADPVEQGFPFEVAAPRANWEWDQDERFEELIEQLAINEASLEAIDVAIARKTRSSRSRQSSARRFDDNNRLMDRKGGGPMNWREFYGTNAEKFFYHPVDPSTTYHTRTYLQQAGKDEDDKSGSDIPTRQSLPVHQRPPQWDYIYRANRTAREQALADAATLQSEVAQLEERRLLLEQEQAELWCRLAFRAVRRHDMHRKPVVRFAVLPAGPTPAAVDQAEAIAAAAAFFSTALQVVMKADEDQPVALVSAKPLIVKAWYDLDDAMLGKNSLAATLNDTESPLGQFMALAKMLSDKARTLTESFDGTRDTIAVNDPIRKDRYRGMLQRAVVDYAQIVLGLDELLDIMRRDWGVEIDTSQQLSSTRPEWSPVATKPPSPRNTATDNHLNDLQGVWIAVEVDRHGTMLTPQEIRDQSRTITIKGNTLTFNETQNGQTFSFGGIFTLDQQRKAIDLTGKGPRGADFNLLAIYDINGDQLRFCYRRNANGRAERPTDFRAYREHPNHSMSYTLMRQVKN